MTIGTLAQTSGATVDTIRFYEKRGLLPPPPRTAGGFRDYDEGAVARLAAIARGKRLGFTLDEIRALLHWREVGEDDAALVRSVAADRLAQTERALADLARQRDELAALVGACGGAETPRHDCPILAEIAP